MIAKSFAISSNSGPQDKLPEAPSTSITKFNELDQLQVYCLLSSQIAIPCKGEKDRTEVFRKPQTNDPTNMKFS